jgi:hypothetical protein
MARARGAGADIRSAVAQAYDVVVKVQVIYRPNDHYAELIAYVAYLAKEGKGDHFTREGEPVDIPLFLSRLWKAPWCFKVILSPTPHRSSGVSLQEVAQSWMQQVDADLGCRLDWVGSVHHDTDTPHVQFLWSGRTRAGQPVRIDRDYLSYGLRGRASEMLDLYGAN